MTTIDSDIIVSCYGKEIEKVYSTFTSACIAARGEKDHEKSEKMKEAAEAAFITGVQFAKGVRDRALSILPKSNPLG